MLAFFSALIQVNEDLKTIGALAGLLAVPGLAVLSLLYFGQAREVRRLRDWAGRAPERSAELEQRVTAEAQRRTQVGGTAPATPAAQAATGTATPAPPGNGVAKTPPAAPATVAAQAATTDGDKKPEEAKKDEEEGKKPGEAAAEKKDADEEKKEEGDKQPDEAKKEPVAAAPASASAAAAGPPTTASPAATPAGATAAATAAARARTPAPPVPPRPAQPVRANVPSATIPPNSGARRPGGGGTDSGGPRVSRGGLIGIGAAVLVLAITVAIVLKVTGGSDQPTPAPNTVAGSPADQPAAGSKTPAPAATKAQRAQTNVAVLNGTTVTGLARSVANRLQDQGYTVGNVTDAPNQAQPQTKVEFGSGHRDEARALATAIKVPASRVIALSPDDSTTAGPNAEVVVVVGQDSAR